MTILAIITWTLVFYLLLDEKLNLSNEVLKGALSLLAASSLTSFGFILSVFSYTPFYLFQWGFWGISLLLVGLKRKALEAVWKSMKAPKKETSDAFNTLTLVCILIFSWLFFDFVKKWGEVDALAMWTVHAKYLLDEHSFVNLFVGNTVHPDYPMMLPCLIASIWKAIGNQSYWVPVIIAYVTSLSLITVLVTALLSHQKKAFAIIALALMTCTGMVYEYGALLYADTLLAAFILIPFVLLSFIPQKASPWNYILLGFFAASCGWIKNEGIAFFLIFACFLLFRYRKNLPQYGYFLLGALIPVLMILWFKLGYAPENDLTFRQKGDITDKLLDFNRYVTILASYLSNILKKFSLVLVLFVMLLITNFRHLWNSNFLILYILLGIFFFIYLTTPYDLIWHLKSSFHRLFHQMTPTIMFTIFMLWDEKKMLYTEASKHRFN